MADYESLFPINMQERPLRYERPPTDTAKLLREELARVYGQQRKVTDRLLISMAQTRFQLGRVRHDLQARETGADLQSLADAVEIIGENLQDLLDEHGVRTNDLTDQPWTAEMRGEVDVRGRQIRDDIDQPRVAYMELPVVHRQDRLIAKGAAFVEAPKRD